MALTLGSTYFNSFWDFILDPIKTKIDAEFANGNSYISPKYLEVGNFCIRIWGNESETENYVAAGWDRSYDVDIVFYYLEANPTLDTEVFYKHILSDAERCYQMLFNECKAIMTSKVYDGGTITRGLYNGVCESFVINEFQGEEESVDNLTTVTFKFTCKLMDD